MLRKTFSLTIKLIILVVEISNFPKSSHKSQNENLKSQKIFYGRFQTFNTNKICECRKQKAKFNVW